MIRLMLILDLARFMYSLTAGRYNQFMVSLQILLLKFQLDPGQRTLSPAPPLLLQDGGTLGCGGGDVAARLGGGMVVGAG